MTTRTEEGEAQRMGERHGQRDATVDTARSESSAENSLINTVKTVGYRLDTLSGREAIRERAYLLTYVSTWGEIMKTKELEN